MDWEKPGKYYKELANSPKWIENSPASGACAQYRIILDWWKVWPFLQGSEETAKGHDHASGLQATGGENIPTKPHSISVFILLYELLVGGHASALAATNINLSAMKLHCTQRNYIGKSKCSTVNSLPKDMIIRTDKIWCQNTHTHIIPHTHTHTQTHTHRYSHTGQMHMAFDFVNIILMFSSVQFSPLTVSVIGETWGTIQQRSSSSPFCRRL